MLFFRSTPEKGGETAFPWAKTRTGERVTVKSTRRDAVLFYKCVPDRPTCQAFWWQGHRALSEQASPSQRNQRLPCLAEAVYKLCQVNPLFP